METKPDKVIGRSSEFMVKNQIGNIPDITYGIDKTLISAADEKITRSE